MEIAAFRPDRFETAVPAYVAGRLRYDTEMLAWLVEMTGAAGRRVLDLGCGPGFIANAVAPYVGAVLGLDPSPSMVAAAEAEAAPNARFAVGSSYDLSAVEAPVQLVTIGRAFHWMDRAATLRAFETLVAPDGAVALIGDRVVKGPESAWWHASNEVAKAHAVKEPFHDAVEAGTWRPHEELLAASAFSRLKRISVHVRQSWDAETLRANILSRSGNTEARLGARKAAMLADLDAALAPYGPGPWSCLHEHTALVATRP